MTITVSESEDSGEVTIKVVGRFDFSCHQAFIDGFRQFPKGEKLFTVDLAETEYMDSSALGMLLQMRDHAIKNQANVSLVNANDSVLEILKISNFSKLFDVDGIE